MVSPAERKRVKAALLAHAESLQAVADRESQSDMSRYRLRMTERMDRMLAQDDRPLAERLGLQRWTTGNDVRED